MASKVPAVTLAFWIVYVAATTLGETGGDAVSDTLDWGYLGGTAFFLVLFVVLAVAQIRAPKLYPALFWATTVASTMFGTTTADFADRSLGLGYAGGSTLLFACVLIVLGLWHRAQGTIAVGSVTAPKAEIFFWIAITFSQTLGTALGDWVSDGWDLGSATGALVFAIGLAVVAGLYFWTSASRVLLFWAALILARPLGATFGDFLDQPHDQGGLALSRPLASAIIAAFIILCLFVQWRRTAQSAEPSI
ncbi:MAG: COG4705 family protein [Stellaceae bacterium]